MALIQLQAEFDIDSANFSGPLQEVFQLGIMVTMVRYDDAGDRFMWQAGCHDEESNKYKPTTIRPWALMPKNALQLRQARL